MFYKGITFPFTLVENVSEYNLKKYGPDAITFNDITKLKVDAWFICLILKTGKPKVHQFPQTDEEVWDSSNY